MSSSAAGSASTTTSAPSALTVPSSSWSSSRDLLSSAIFPFLQFQQELMAHCILVDKCWYGAAQRMPSLKLEWPLPMASRSLPLHELNASSSPFLYHLTRFKSLRLDDLHELDKSTSQLKNIQVIRIHLDINGDKADWKEKLVLLTFPKSLRELFFELSAEAKTGETVVDILSTVLIQLSRQLKTRNPSLEVLRLRIRTCDGEVGDGKGYDAEDGGHSCTPLEFLKNLSALPALHTYETDSDQSVTTLSEEQFAALRSFPALTRLHYQTELETHDFAKALRALLPSDSEAVTRQQQQQPLKLSILPFTDEIVCLSSEVAKLLHQYHWLQKLKLKTSFIPSHDIPKQQLQQSFVEDDISFLPLLSVLTELSITDSNKNRPLPRLISGSTLVTHIGTMVQLTSLHLSYFTMATSEMTFMLEKLTQLRSLSLETIFGLDSLTFLSSSPSLSRSLRKFRFCQYSQDNHIKLPISEIEHIFSLSRLESIHMSGVFVSEVPNEVLARLKHDQPEFDYRLVPHLNSVDIRT